MPIRLYNFAFGPYPQRVNIYLAEKNPPDVERVIFDAPDKLADLPPAAIKALTPTGSLPILQDADGTVVGQSLAILEYLEGRVSGPNLLGTTLAAEARTRQFIQVFDEALTFFGLWARHGSNLGRGEMRISREVVEICAARYFGQLRLIEKMMGQSDFITGDDVTIADCVAMATLQYVADFYDVPVPGDCQKLARWCAAFSRRPSAASPHYPEAKRSIALGLMAQTGVAI